MSIGFVGSTLYGMLPRIIRRFRTEHAEIELTLHEMSTMDQIKALKEGRIDVGFGRIRHEDPAVRRVVLREERMIVALPVGHPLSIGRKMLALPDLLDDTLIIFPRRRARVLPTRCWRRFTTARCVRAASTRYASCRSHWGWWRWARVSRWYPAAFRPQA
jgi:DNA-binding transcriptional LysR family regulator